MMVNGIGSPKIHFSGPFGVTFRRCGELGEPRLGITSSQFSLLQVKRHVNSSSENSGITVQSSSFCYPMFKLGILFVLDPLLCCQLVGCFLHE